VLYLAEVKKQTRGFIGGIKAELKLIACQHNDQSWSALPTEEAIVWEDSQAQFGEGALLLVNLGSNRQIQGSPELAGAQLVGELRKISRLMEKFKEQQQEIEQWKVSLSLQAEELSRREIELNARDEQIQQLEVEFEYLERQRLELDEIREAIAKEQQRLEEARSELGFSAGLDEEKSAKIQSLIGRLLQDSHASPWDQLALILDAIGHQQTRISTYQQQLAGKQRQLEQQKNTAGQQQEKINQKQQELDSIKIALEEARTERKVQQTVLTYRQDLLTRINQKLESISSLKSLFMGASLGSSTVSAASPINLQELENMPLGELQEKVSELQSNLDNLVKFVNEQEEELTLQNQTIKELQAQLETGDGVDSLEIEEQIKDEQERKKMLEKTLEPQRQTVWNRQDECLQYLRVLRRRQGILDPQEQVTGISIKIEPIMNSLQQEQEQAEGEKGNLEQEIENLQYNLRQLEEMIEDYTSQQQQKSQQLQQDKEAWEHNKLTLAEIQAQISLYQEGFQPLQESFNDINAKFKELGDWFGISRDR
jgi:chromosome segregation ATPase